MKNHLFFFFLSLLLGSCVIHYDSLRYYKKGYSPNNEGFPTKGFYYTSPDSSVMERYGPNVIIELYFFKNGTLRYGGYVESLDTLDKWICQYDTNSVKSGGPIGFYTIQNDTIFAELIETDPMGDHTATRSDFKALRTPDGIKILGWDGETSEKNWTFHPNNCVPDSTHNWIVTHRKYRIEP